MYLVSPEDYQLLRNSGNASADVDQNKHNTSMLQDSMLQKNEKETAWKQYGDKMDRIITAGIDKSKLSVAPVNTTLPATSITSPQEEEEEATDHEVSFIRLGAPSKLINKISRLYNLIKQLPGVLINSKTISIDGSVQQGTTLDILKNLASTNKYLRFECDALLSRIATRADISALITNQEGKETIRRLTLEGPITSTPHALREIERGRPRWPFNLDDTDDRPFKSTPKKRGEGIRGKKKKKLIKWASLF